MTERVDLGNVRGERGIQGIGISDIKYDRTEDLTDYYTIIFDDDSTREFQVVNSANVRDFTTDRVQDVDIRGEDAKNYYPSLYAIRNSLNEYYNKDAIDELIRNIDLIIVVEDIYALSLEEIKENRIYLEYKSPDSSDGLNNSFDLYIYTDEDWRQLDSLEFNIADYLTKYEASRLYSVVNHNHTDDDIFLQNSLPYLELDQGQMLGEFTVLVDEELSNLSNQHLTVDSSMSDSSQNAVQNKVIKGYVDAKIDSATGGITSGDIVTFTRNLNSGTKIGTITINGASTDIYSTNDTTYNAVTQSANGLMTSSDKQKLDKSMSVAYGVSGGSASALTVTLTGVTLTNGTIIAVYNNTANNNANATLNVNGLGAKAIYYKGAKITANVFPKNTTCLFVYNTTLLSGGCWQMLEFDTTYSNVTSSSNGLMLASDKTKLDGISENANNYTHPSYTARTGKPTGNQSPSFGGTFTVSQMTSDSTGHITNATDRTVTIPSTVASTSSNGLMSSTDKTKLNGVEANANKYTHPSYTARTGVPTGNQTPSFGATFNVGQVTSDGTGHITGITSRTVKIPNNTASTSSNGLMSSSDKSKLDALSLTCATENDSATNNYLKVYYNSFLVFVELRMTGVSAVKGSKTLFSLGEVWTEDNKNIAPPVPNRVRNAYGTIDTFVSASFNSETGYCDFILTSPQAIDSLTVNASFVWRRQG